MKIIIKQAIYLIACSILIGVLYNFFQPNGISFLAKEDIVSEQFNDYLIKNLNIDSAKIMYDEGVVFIDARHISAYSEGHISGAFLSDNYDFLLDKLFFNHEMDDPIVIYCDNSECGLSEELAIQLELDGFSNLYIFKGGWGEWLKVGYPVEK